MSKVIRILHENLVYDRRACVLARNLDKFLPTGSRVLDVGCGDGTLAALIMEKRPDVAIRGLDVLIRPATRIPVGRFDGAILPCAEKSFDVVSFIDVLHHTDDPTLLLREAKRVARKFVVLKDHTMNGSFAYLTLRFMDWVGNAHDGVVLPYNYWPERRWREAFSELEMPIARWQTNLNLYPFPASMIFERHLHFIAALAVA
jgi:SAM-dependent methyltransferase